MIIKIMSIYNTVPTDLQNRKLLARIELASLAFLGDEKSYPHGICGSEKHDVS